MEGQGIINRYTSIATSTPKKPKC